MFSIIEYVSVSDVLRNDGNEHNDQNDPATALRIPRHGLIFTFYLRRILGVWVQKIYR